jgi:hypothetical protein
MNGVSAKNTVKDPKTIIAIKAGRIRVSDLSLEVGFGDSD